MKMSSSSNITSELLRREEALRAENDALNRQTEAVNFANAALQETLAARTEDKWDGVDLGDDAQPLAGMQRAASSQLKTLRARKAAVAEERAMQSLRAKAVAEDEQSAASQPGPASAGSPSRVSGNSRIPSLRGRASGRVSEGGKHTGGGAVGQVEVGTGAQAAPALVSTEVDTYIDPDLPVETQLKLLRSALRVAKHELAESRTENAGLANEAVEFKKLAAAGAEERTRLNRAAAAAEVALEKARKAAASAEAREAEVRAHVINLGKESASAARAAKQAEGSSAAMDARVVRLQEELERLKAQITSERSAAHDISSSLRSEVEGLTLSLRKTERQRNELLAAFKKQAKLVSVLKRTRLHMEAARLLAFTEEEFAKAIGVQAP